MSHSVPDDLRNPQAGGGSDEAVRAFHDPEAHFQNIDGKGVAELVFSGSDITLVLSEGGLIEDVAYRDRTFDDLKAHSWIGKQWSEVVTSESGDKIAALLKDVRKAGAGASRQVSHPVRPGYDLPVTYRLVRPSYGKSLLAFGENQSQIASAQTRLLQSHMELESDYRKLRETEVRYRTIFQISSDAVLVVNGGNRTILDGNRAAAKLFGKEVQKLVGDPVVNVLDRASRKNAVEILTEAHHQGSSKRFEAQSTYDGVKCVISVEPFRENGQNNLLLKFDCSNAEAAIANRSGADELQLLRTLPEGVVLLDAQGNVVEANEKFLDLINAVSKERLVGRHISNWIGASSVDSQVLLSKLKKEGQVTNFATIAQGETGESSDVAISAATSTGAETQFVLILSDARRRDASQMARPAGPESAPGGISELVGRVPMKELIRDSVDVIEKMCIEAALTQTNNNRASAADLLGLSRQSLYIKLNRYGLEDFGQNS